MGQTKLCDCGYAAVDISELQKRINKDLVIAVVNTLPFNIDDYVVLRENELAMKDDTGTLKPKEAYHMRTIDLNNGTTMPTLGFGLWMVKDEQQCLDVVKQALEAGYRHFDTAQMYKNEQFVGTALAKSDLDRQELFITTKILPDNMWWVDLIPSFEESLKNLQTDYVDLLLLHFPVTELRRPAWQRMQELVQDGRARAIGVSNYTIEHLEELFRESSTKPAVNQVELHVYLQQPELVDFCKQHDIVVEAYSPLAHGYDLDNSILIEIGKKYGKSPAQVMIRWCLEVGTVPLPKTVHQDRMRENNSIFDFSLDAYDMRRLATLDRDYRTAWDPTHVG